MVISDLERERRGGKKTLQSQLEFGTPSDVDLVFHIQDLINGTSNRNGAPVEELKYSQFPCLELSIS